MVVFREAFGDQLSVTVNQEEAKLLRSIVEFIGRENNKLLAKAEITEEETTFANQLNDELTPYLDEEEIDIHNYWKG